MSLGPAATYTDGIPVKISEKYKPPPLISVPSGLFEQVSSLSNYVQAIEYDFTLENNVLRKLEEWRNAKDTLINERNHRLQLKEEAKQRELDQIAANEEKLKQLSVSEVSYPSADEISEISPDDTAEIERCDEPEQHISEPKPTEELPNILQPIPAPVNGYIDRFNLLDDLDSIKRFQQSVKMKSKLSGYGCNMNNVDKLNFSDFENDTSSPFDNLELKTINDLELLAQVWKVQSNAENVNNSTININETVSPGQLYATSGNTEMYSPVPTYGNSVPNNSVMNSSNPYSISSTYNIPNQYNHRSDLNYSNSQMNNEHLYYPANYNYSNSTMVYGQVPENNSFSESNKQNYQTVSDSYVSDNTNSYNNPYKFNNVDYTAYNPITNFEQSEPIKECPDEGNNQSLMKTRSRSVPDIVKELDNEVAEARLKSRERSHNCSPAPNQIVKADPSSSRPIHKENLSNPFDNLSPKLQLMCNFIHGMGFPMDRVARACEDIGEDDKKIIEYLLSMGQLMDLGFPESKVAKALLQHNCNRDKALDELIS